MITVHPFTYSFTTCFKEREITDLLKQNTLGEKILEMGCGSAYFSTVLRRNFPNAHFQYNGVDLEADAIQVAKNFVTPTDRLTTGSVTALPYEANQFDTILYLDVIEHVDNDQKSLEESFRVLKSGGKLIISTPHAGALLTDTFFCEYMHDHDHMANHKPGYHAGELSKMLEKAGFKIQNVRFSNVFLSEILITITKLGYRLKKQKYSSQADMIEVSNSWLFKVHKFIFFPIGYFIGLLETVLLRKILKGHCLIIEARKI